MKRILLFVSLAFGAIPMIAQNAQPASGGEASGSSGSMSYSVGQVFTATSNTVSEGVLQAYELFVTAGIDRIDVKVFVSTYPNPVTDLLTIECEDFKKMSYQLFSLEGKLLKSETMTESKSLIDMSPYKSAIYILNVVEKKKNVKSIKIIKL